MKKRVLIMILSMTMLIGGTLTANAAAGMGKTARIAKSTNATVYSDVTGSYLGYASFGAICTKGPMTVTALQYAGVDQGYIYGLHKTAEAGENKSWVTSKTGRKMWKVKVSEKKGRGIGWIKGE